MLYLPPGTYNSYSYSEEDLFSSSLEASLDSADSSLPPPPPPSRSESARVVNQSPDANRFSEAVGATLRAKLESTSGDGANPSSEVPQLPLDGNVHSPHSIVNDMALSTLEKSITSGSSDLAPDSHVSEPDNSRPQSDIEDESTQEHRSVDQTRNVQAKSHDSSPGSHDDHVTLNEAEEPVKASVSPTYDQMMAEARRKAEELKAKGILYCLQTLYAHTTVNTTVTVWNIRCILFHVVFVITVTLVVVYTNTHTV